MEEAVDNVLTTKQGRSCVLGIGTGNEMLFFQKMLRIVLNRLLHMKCSISFKKFQPNPRCWSAS